MGDPKTDLNRGTFFIRRLRRDATGTNTLNACSIGFVCCVSDIELDTFSEEDKSADFLPPLAETDYAPVTDAMLLQGWHLDGIHPPPAHLLYICVKTGSLGGLKLGVEFTFTEEAQTAEEFLAQPAKELESMTIQIDFDSQRKTPDGGFFLRLLFISGGSPCLLDFKFDGTTIFDVADDSAQGFPAVVKLFLVRGTDLRSRANLELRKETERTLLMMESIPDYVMEPEPSDAVLTELAGADEADLSLSADGKIRIGPDGKWTAVG